MDASVVTSSQVKRLVLSFLLSTLLGLVVTLNQLGSIIALYLPIDSFSFIWNVNTVAAPLSYSWTLLLLFGLALLCSRTFRPISQCHTAYARGLALGFVALPAVALILLVLFAALWIVFKVLSFIGSILGTIVGWLVENVLAPVVRFLGIPFVWLWEHGLGAIVRFLIWPFAWLLEHVLVPIIGLLLRFVLLPIGALVATFCLAGLALAPFAAVGRVFVSSANTAAKGPLSPQGAFEQGIALGLMSLDALVMAILRLTGLGSPDPSLFLLLAAAFPLVYAFRFFMNRAAAAQRQWTTSPLRAHCESYARTSGLEAIVACVGLPVAVALHVAAQGDEGQ